MFNLLIGEDLEDVLPFDDDFIDQQTLDSHQRPGCFAVERPVGVAPGEPIRGRPRRV